MRLLATSDRCRCSHRAVGVLGWLLRQLRSNFDPSDLLDFLDTKKKLPGERKPVFPEGVPGLEQGVPKELYKGSARNSTDQQNAQTATAAPPPAGRRTQGEAKSRGKKASSRRPPARLRMRAARGSGRSAAPRIRGRGRRRRGPAASEAQENRPQAYTAPPPDQQAAQPAQQPTATAQQQSASPFPAPLPSGSFQR